MTASVSGPGPYSRRPDAGGQPIRALPNAKYGENKSYVEQEKSAPLAKDGGGPPSDLLSASQGGPPAGGQQPPGAGGQLAPLTPLLAPTTRPHEPVTSGVSIGPGPGPEAAGLAPAQPASLTSALRPYLTADTTGILASVARHLAERGM
jgi:hypothetical protein